MEISPIGVIRTPFTDHEGTPIQSVYGDDIEGTVILDTAYVAALADLEGFDRIWLLFALDRAKPWRSKVVPYRDTVERGLFSTRAPSRPNPIGLSVVRVVQVDPPRIVVRGVDMLDGTPLLDIKPYIPEFDAHPDARAGWLDLRRADREAADGRFMDPSEHGPRVRLDLTEHCIETAARNEHRRRTALALAGDDGQGPALAVLHRFLAETDFRRLRAQHPDLRGGADIQVEVFSDEDGVVGWRVRARGETA